jgi:hypothetical protein
MEAAQVADQLVATIKLHPAVAGAEPSAVNAFSLGYLNSMLADLMMVSPKVYTEVEKTLAYVQRRAAGLE